MINEPIISNTQYERLKKFSPLFAKYMLEGIMPMGQEKYVNDKGNILGLPSPSCCIVGEVHNFSHLYRISSSFVYCGACTTFSNLFDSEYQSFPDNPPDDIEDYHNIAFLEAMDEFIDHLESVHVDLIKE